jgi:SNF2 family DNA or RNA helicase
MRFQPHNYQRYAIEKIIELSACGLFLDMGMGKTVSTLTAIQELMHDYFEVTKTLIIAPLRVARMTWSSEIEKWDHLQDLKLSKVLGSERDRLRALEADADIYIINRENTEWLVNHFGRAWPFDMVVIDELSSFKSNKSRRFKALRKVRPLINRIVGLTGTPTPNGLIDLWPQIYLLDRGERLGKTITGYRQEYFDPGQRNWQTGVIYNYALKDGAEKIIYKKISDICISMKAEDYLEVPELKEIPIEVELDPKDYKKYKQLERELLLPLSDAEDIEALTAATLSNKLLQMANGAVYDEKRKVHLIHDEKLKALEEIIEAANGKPVIVYYNYKHDLESIKRYFKDVRTLETEEDISDWNAGRVPILALHPASAGHGLNLQHGGNIIVWFGLNWSLELYQQANARLHRQGQTSKVIAYLLVTKGTIDEDVVTALRSKNYTQDNLLNALKARIKNFGGGGNE